MCLQSVMFKLLASIEMELEATLDPDTEATEKDKSGWHETTVVVLNGLTSLLADYLDVLSNHSSFSKSWQTLLNHFRTLLNFEVLEINTAVFKALQKILSRGNLEGSGHINFDQKALDNAWALWSKLLPDVKADPSNKRFDNQHYLMAYVSVLPEIYRLIQANIDGERIRTMLSLLRDAIEQASAASYSADIEYLTSLQSQVLDSLKMIRTDIEGAPAAIIFLVAEIVALPFKPKPNGISDTQKPTYVALSKAAMKLLESVIISHASDEDIYMKGSMAASLAALGKPIGLKYAFPITTKSISPWQQATSSALAILNSVMPIITTPGLKDNQQIKKLWDSIVFIANGITKANCSEAPETANIKDDQEFDIVSFLSLRELITPALGSPTIPDRIRRMYTESLFTISLIHAPQPSEMPQPNQELLATLYQPRKGRTEDPPPSPRSKMSYVCFDTLISLVSLHDSSEARVKLAQAAAPYLILRAGLSLKGYIADQPLRGRMPQPLSQRKELVYILKALVKLRCEPDAIPDAPGVESEGKKHLHRLYPLFAKGVRAAAGDQEVLEWLGKALDEVGMEFGV